MVAWNIDLASFEGQEFILHLQKEVNTVIKFVPSL